MPGGVGGGGGDPSSYPMLEDFAARRRLETGFDRHGNLVVAYRRGRTWRRPEAFCAHMDHPGFVADAMAGGAILRATWRGFVPGELFPGAGVRFLSAGQWIRGRVLNVRPRAHRWGGSRRCRLEMRAPVEPGSIGMWDFPAPFVRGSRLYARGHDCVCGVAAVACVLDEAVRRELEGQFVAFFTRAEEGGFLGAIGAARSRSLPKKTVLIPIETSMALPTARLGDGVVIRVGDRSSIFTPWVTDWLCAAAARLAGRKRNFRCQRRLMDGGTCESSVYTSYGYEAGGLCLPLGNYHNVDWKRMRLGPERIDLGDFEGLVLLLLELAADRKSPRGAGRRKRWEDLFARYGRGLTP